MHPNTSCESAWFLETQEKVTAGSIIEKLKALGLKAVFPAEWLRSSARIPKSPEGCLGLQLLHTNSTAAILAAGWHVHQPSGLRKTVAHTPTLFPDIPLAPCRGIF